MGKLTAAVFPVMPHLGSCLPVVEELVQGGMRVVVFGDRRAQAAAEDLRAEFVDIFDQEAEATYDDSIPPPIRYVTFAGERADRVVRLLEPHDPAVVILDVFAVVGRVAARLLGLPYVSLQGSHNRHAGQIPEITRLPELRVSERCRSAVDRLREDFGIDDASPFLYRVTSPYLNLYGEPPQWLPPHSRAPFEPVRFFGSLASRSVRQKPARPRASRDESPQTRLRIYAAFGAASGWTRRPEVLPALHAIIDAVESRADTELLIGLGGHPNEGLRRRASSNVRVQSNADQWSALAQSDLFITHNGMKSTHEACFHQVPMISYPVQSDQPGLARRCQELDVAVPLSREYRGPVDAHDVLNAINRVLGRLSVMRTALAQARQWEEEVVDGRSEIVAEIAELAASGRPTG